MRSRSRSARAYLISAEFHPIRMGVESREAVGANSYLGFTITNGSAITSTQMPLTNKNDTGQWSH